MQRQRLPRSAWRIVSSLGDGIAREEVRCRQDHAGRAEAALQAVVLDERALERVELAVLREPLDRRDLAALGLEREHGAALHGASVEEHGARAALARVAPDVRSGETEPVAQRVDEERPAFDLERALLAVDDERRRCQTPAGSVASLSRRYARYGCGSIVGDPVSRSIVSFGVNLRPSE